MISAQKRILDYTLLVHIGAIPSDCCSSYIMLYPCHLWLYPRLCYLHRFPIIYSIYRILLLLVRILVWWLSVKHSSVLVNLLPFVVVQTPLFVGGISIGYACNALLRQSSLFAR